MERQAGKRWRFGVFEADSATGELRRKGMRVRLHAQPFQVLAMLLERPGEMLTREEISRVLWPEGTFVDFDHGVNSAVNRLREALGDRAANPRFVETLARRGYRFVAPVEVVGSAEAGVPVALTAPAAPAAWAETCDSAEDMAFTPPAREGFLTGLLATEADLPRSPHRLVRTLFLLLQVMYVGFYVGALANLGEISDLLAALPVAEGIFLLMAASAALLIPVRAFLLAAVAFRAPAFRAKYLRLWWGLLAADLVWSLAPFLLLHHISFGLALACTTLLVYAPFAQRSLMLMGAAGER